MVSQSWLRRLTRIWIAVLALACMPGASVAAVAAPSVPGSFQATITGTNAIVTLSWQPSSAPYGIKGYEIDRSLDQVTWTSLVSGLNATTYNDSTVAYGVHYYYRLSAVDPKGQASGYAYADAETTTFTSNFSSDAGGASFTSADGIAKVSVPANAMPGTAECSVTLVSLSGSPTSSGRSLVAGPYSLTCKQSDGGQVVGFAKPVTWQYDLKGLLKGSSNPQPYEYGGAPGQNTLIGGATLSGGQLVFAEASENPTMVVADVPAGLPINLILALMFVVALMLGLALLMSKQQQRTSFRNYIRSKYYEI